MSIIASCSTLLLCVLFILLCYTFGIPNCPCICINITALPYGDYDQHSWTPTLDQVKGFIFHLLALFHHPHCLHPVSTGFHRASRFLWSIISLMRMHRGYLSNPNTTFLCDTSHEIASLFCFLPLLLSTKTVAKPHIVPFSKPNKIIANYFVLKLETVG